MVLEVGCSYGVNAALLRHGLPFAHVRERYLTPAMQEVPLEHIAELDRRYFSGWPARKDVRFIGLDTSVGAIAYGRRAGLFEAGLAIDLEKERLNASARVLVTRADLVISTGGVGSVTEKTFAKLMAAFPAKRRPWVASFVLRTCDYSRIAEALARNGLATDKLEGATFVQRRFRDSREQREAVAALERLGVDPTGKEAEGQVYAELFLSRPAKAVGAALLSEIVSLPSATSRLHSGRPTALNRSAVAA
jgi:hypothetical protein